MVKHIVMWKLWETAAGYSREENARRIKQNLEGMKSHIPQIKFLEVGINFNSSAAAFDVALYSEFNDREDLQIYQQHPQHVKFKEMIQSLRSDRVVIDYEV
ncbi:MAG: Dabb family protein [bacterium]|nr:Dabb family protein [bacterium]